MKSCVVGIRLLRSNEKQFRGGLVFKARRRVVSLNSRPRVIKKKKKGIRDSLFWHGFSFLLGRILEHPLEHQKLSLRSLEVSKVN